MVSPGAALDEIGKGRTRLPDDEYVTLVREELLATIVFPQVGQEVPPKTVVTQLLWYSLLFLG
jgi:hypothetical protein